MLSVQSPEAPDEFVLRDQLVSEAAALFKRLGDAFQECTGIAPRTTHWHAISRAGAAQIAEAERVLGLSLPADLVACYLACSGVTEMCGWHWQPFGDIVLNTRMMNTIAYELRADDPTWFMSPQGFNEEGTVRAGFWNRGWLPIATGHGERGAVWLCVDTAPGPNGHWGQILEVEDKRGWPPGLQPALVAAPARRVAKGFMEFFDTLASALELRPMDAAVTHWAEKKNERRLQADLVVTGKPPMVESNVLSLMRSRRALKSVQPTDASAASLMAEPEFDLHTLSEPHKRLTPERKRRFTLPRKSWVLPIEREPRECRGPENPTGDQQDSETWLHQWSESKAPSFVFMTGWMGEGKTDALLALAEQMAKLGAKDTSARVPLYINLQHHSPPTVQEDAVPKTLRALIRAELSRRGLADAPNTVLSAVAAGQCLLILDQVEAIAPYRDSVWTWSQQLPAVTAAALKRAPHVLICCADEWFDSDDSRQANVLAFAASRVRPDEAVAYMVFNPEVNDEIRKAWFEACGLSIEQPAIRSTWEAFGGRRRLPAVLGTFRHLFEKPSAAVLANHTAAATAEATKAWWAHVVPNDLGLDEAALMQLDAQIGMYLTVSTNPHGHEVFLSLSTYLALVAQSAPGASTPILKRRAMYLRAALQLNVRSDGAVRGGAGLIWLTMQHAENLQSSSPEIAVGQIVATLPLGRSAALILSLIATCWMQKGNAGPWCGARELLVDSRLDARTAGAVFRLGVCMARAYVEDERDPDVKSKLLREHLNSTLPSPLSGAQLKGADLCGIDFSGLTLQDLDLTGALLQDTNFSKATLTRVCLDGCNAERADFSEAVLNDVSGQKLNAKQSRWLDATWNRAWPDADFAGAALSVFGVSPASANTEFRFVTLDGAPRYALQKLDHSPDGKWIAAIGDAGTFGVWSSAGPSARWHVQMPQAGGREVLDICFSHDSQFLFSSHGDKKIRVWSVAQRALVATHLRVYQEATQLQRDGSGQFIVATGDRGPVEWLTNDPQARRGRMWLSAQSRGSGARLALVRNGTDGFLCSRGRTGGVDDVGPNRRYREVAWASKRAWGVAHAHDVVAGHGWLAVLDVNAVTVGDPLAEKAAWQFERYGSVVNSADYLERPAKRSRKPEGGFTPEIFDQLYGEEALDREAKVSDMAFSPDGRWLVCVGGDAWPMAFDLHSGTSQRIETLARIHCAAFSPDGQHLILGGSKLIAVAAPSAQAANATPP